MKINGLLLVNKIPGCTSHDVVDQVRHLFRLRKVGHTGTLDPQAEGLLILCLGKATRLQQYLTGMDKVYVGDIRFGYSTTTYDAEGEPTSEPIEIELDSQQLHELAKHHVGNVLQSPPPFSAKRYKGKRFYEMARSGEKVPHLEKEVRIHDFHFEEIELNRGSFYIHCGSGTYLRTIAQELGQELGCGAYLSYLKRLKIGPFDVEEAITIEELAAASDRLSGNHFIPLEQVKLPYPTLKMDCLTATKLLGGQKVNYYDLDFTSDEREGIAQILSPTGKLLCLGQYTIDGRGMLEVEPKVVLQDVCD